MALDVEPVIAPGLIIQLPVGKPLKTTLPLAMVHVGCVKVPNVGAEGVTGCDLITTSSDSPEIQPLALVTE